MAISGLCRRDNSAAPLSKSDCKSIDLRLTVRCTVCVNHKLALLLIFLLANRVPAILQAQTAFVYQGHLEESGQPANGNYDLQFGLTDAPVEGNHVTNLVTNLAVPVSNGMFKVTLDFGAAFDGSARWLEVGVRTNTSAVPFFVLSPRQAVSAVPYAVFAGTARAANLATNLDGGGANLTNVNASSLQGVVPLVHLAGITSQQLSPETDAAYRATDTNIVRQLVRTTAGQGRVTPFDFGAKGDGVKDDTVALQAWIDMAQASNYVAELPPASKYYLITDALYVRSLGGITIIGSGGQSHVTGDPTTRSMIYQATFGKHGLVITNALGTGTPTDNVYLQGFALSAKTYCPTNYGIAFLGGIPDSDVDVIMNVGVRNFGVGLFNGSGCNLSVISCSFGGGGDGIQINGPVVNSVLIQSTICTGNRSNGLNVVSAGNVTFDTGDLVTWPGYESRLASIRSGTVILRNINGEHGSPLEAIQIWSPKRNATVILDGGTITLMGTAASTNSYSLSISNASSVTINGTQLNMRSSDGFPIVEYQSPPVATSLKPWPEKIVLGGLQEVNWIGNHLRTSIPRFDGTRPTDAPVFLGMTHAGLFRVLNSPGDTDLQFSAYLTPYNNQLSPVYVPLLQYAKDKLSTMTVNNLKVLGSITGGTNSPLSGSFASYPDVITRVLYENGVVKTVSQETWDLDATSYCARAQLSSNPMEMAAADTLVKSLKKEGLWNLADAIYLFRGGQSNSAALNLISTNYPIQWSGLAASSFDATGVTGDGLGYGVSGLVPAYANHFSTNSSSLFVYLGNTPNPSSHFLGSIAGGSYVRLAWHASQNSVEGLLNGGSCSIATTNFPGPWLISRVNNGVGFMLGGSTTNYFSGMSTNLPVAQLGVLCSMSADGVAHGATSANLRAAWVGAGLTISQASTLFKCFDAYMATLQLKVD
jgi:hypothetical protein